jgi:hypothetical protein
MRTSDAVSDAACDRQREGALKIGSLENRTFSGPSPEAMEACDEFLLDELARDFDLIESYAISGKEAARRGDRDEVRLRLRIQLRDLFRHAVQLHDLLAPRLSQGSGS